MKRTLFLLFCLLFLQTDSNSAELAKDGATGWKIVLPNKPTIVEKTAVRELFEHLKLVTDAEFRTIAEKDIPVGRKSLIFVGNTAKAPKKDYKFAEMLIKMDGENLILAGHDRRGYLYAVYSFLQDIVGIRWWSPEATFIPKKPTLVIADDLNVSYTPQLISRAMHHRLAQPTVFSAGLILASSTSAPTRPSGSPTDTIPSWTQSSSTVLYLSKRSSWPEIFRIFLS